MVVAAKELMAAAVDLLYPRNCQCCGRPLARHERGVICAACLSTVRWISPPVCSRCALPFAGVIEGRFECGYCQEMDWHFSRAAAACLARGVVMNAIHEFKYNRKLYFGPHLAEWIITAGREHVLWETVDAIVPVPLHPRKKREREFNQAEYLADALGQAFAKPIWKRNLRRVRDTKTQTRLSREQRLQNLRDAFAVRDSESLRGRRILLVDDVFTTGATLDACARVLRMAGASEVSVLTVARGAYV